MNQKELRIGNFIIRPDIGDGHDRMEQVLELGEKLITTGPIKVVCRYEELKPVPLTPDILERFGFVQREAFGKLKLDEWVYKMLNFDIHLHGPVYEHWQVGFNFKRIVPFIIIDHVHQLQNLFFALTGSELTYESDIKTTQG